MFSKEQTKEEVRKLVEKYKELVETGDPQKLTEEETKKDFILPLFHVLNWDTQNSKEVSAEETISKKRVDYGFRIDGIPKFFLETKSLREKLETEYAEQAINYSWLKSTTWAVLTNFVELKVYNAEWKAKSSIDKIFFELKWTEFIEKFDKLWLLSKDSFLQNELDKTAEEWGKKQKKTPVTPVMKQLFNDLMIWRQRLTRNISGYKTNMEILKTEETLDECIQRILDRLIFIRVCEDREIEPRTLLSKLREWKGGRKGKLFIQLLNDVFREFDKNYNSKLFSKHISEELVVDDVILNDIIHELYESSDRIFKYDFAAIDADVFGNIYEEYLGYVLKKGKGKVAENHLHRKEMGIYYTPTFVVDYIVRNTLGELLKQKGDGKIKVLDPACGSGSFLIKAFEVFLNYYKDSKQLSFEDKVNILKNNIFGVDLDPKAAEIAQLNLLLRAVEKRKLLPMLHNNIKIGNSLIDDSKIARDNAFDWNEEFKDIMKEGGFDVVIGNPPYGAKFNDKEKSYLKIKYPSSDIEIESYILFIEKALDLLKDDGYLGFILPSNILTNVRYEKIRKLIFDKCFIQNILDLGSDVFGGASVDTCLLILKKSVSKNRKIKTAHSIKSPINLVEIKYNLIDQKKFKENPAYIFNIYVSELVNRLLSKIENNTSSLKNFVDISRGIEFGYNSKYVLSKRTNENYKPLIAGRCLNRYNIYFDNKFVLFDESNKKIFKDKAIYESEKLLLRRIGHELIATYDDQKIYNVCDVYNILIKHKSPISLKFVLSLLNSKLLSFYLANKFKSAKKLFPKIPIENILKLSIKLPPNKQQKEIIELVDKILELNKELQKVGKLSDKGEKLQEEINKIDKEIDQKVYELYGLTLEEIKLVESS
jgi:type I restriction-modification system DNA methylase subunit/predicted type IV restriction endonuclease